MSGREVALCLVSGLTVASVAGMAAALVMSRKPRKCEGDAVLVLALALVCLVWAVIGWAWYLVTGVLR